MLSFFPCYLIEENKKSQSGAISFRRFIKNINSSNISGEKILKIESVYRSKIKNDFVKKLISAVKNTVFLDNGCRILSFGEILQADTDLKVSFKKKNLLPLADCSDNNFIVYDLDKETFSKFNIVDETVYDGGKRSFVDFFKK